MKLVTHLLLTLVISVSGAAQSQERGEDIQLVCHGGAEKPTTEVHNGSKWNAQQQQQQQQQRKYVSGRCDADEGHRRF